MTSHPVLELLRSSLQGEDAVESCCWTAFSELLRSVSGDTLDFIQEIAGAGFSILSATIRKGPSARDFSVVDDDADPRSG